MYEELNSLLTQEKKQPFVFRRSFRSSYGLIFLALALGVLVIKVLSSWTEFGFFSRILAILPIVPLLEIARRYYNDLYVITRDRVTHYAGRISLKFSVPSVRCIDLRAITVSQGLVGRMMNFGDVSLSTAAQDGNELILTGMISPQRLATVIDNLRQSSQKAVLDNASPSARSQLSQGE